MHALPYSYPYRKSRRHNYYRAIRILKEADSILAEDTRTTKILLNHYGIEKKIFSHHAFNEHHTTPEIINLLQQDKTIALVTDAGTPCISDPGFYLVRECIKNNIKVECLPGATAFVPALINSGLPSDKFCFEGFLPQKKGRKTAINNLKDETRTMIFYESPFRLVKTLETFAETFGNRTQSFRFARAYQNV